jgi:DNA repair exonuclease SbcCD nuclease subunit
MNLQNIRKINLVGDLHLGIKNNSVEWLEIQKQFLLKFLFKKVDEDFDQDRDILILEGDIFHSRESINVRIQNEAFSIFKQLAQKFKRGVYIIVGNHDVYYKDKTEVNSLKALSHLADNIHVFEKPETLTLNGEHSFLMLPWIEDVSRLSSVVNDYRNLCQYIVCHADIKGLRFNKWTHVEHGLEVEALSTYKRVYGGHIHHRQTVKNVLYTGTPYQMDRGDIGNAKGFYQLDVSTRNLTETFIENTESPVFVKFDIMAVLEMTHAEIIEKFHNNFVDIMINVNFANRFPVTRFLEEISEAAHRKIEFFTYVDQTQAEAEMNAEFNPEEGFNITDIFKMYVKSKDYSQQFRNDLAKKFVEIHQSVKQDNSYA